jgi:holo-[acyl-carrier protein] synthase
MVLTGGAAERLAQITPEGYRAVIHLSLSDDFPWAQAFVVISADLAPMTGEPRPTGSGQPAG